MNQVLVTTFPNTRTLEQGACLMQSIPPNPETVRGFCISARNCRLLRMDGAASYLSIPQRRTVEEMQSDLCALNKRVIEYESVLSQLASTHD